MPQHQIPCVACSGPLDEHDADVLSCAEGHSYTSISLALATNREVVRALWLAIRSLDDDALGLTHLAQRYPDHLAGSRLQEAAEARAAAERLRTHAAAAQRRLRSLEQQVASQA